MHTAHAPFGQLNLKKANFDAIYLSPDPREYFRVLHGLNYVIPELAKGVFRSLIAACRLQKGAALRILDVGCSYGINAALIQYPIDLQRLALRYTDPQMHALTPDELMELDRHYFQAWPQQAHAKFIGLDTSPAAIAYATRAGLLDDGVISDLERQSPTPRETEILRDVDLIISTGCIGYIGHQTFREILQLQSGGQMPWVISFVLRMFSYDAITAELHKFGLVTEKLEGVTFIQRRFYSESEFAETVATLTDRGLDPRGKESDGLLHAELFVSRPASIIDHVPLSSLVSIVSGVSRHYGRRFRSIPSGEVKLMY